MEKRGRRRRGRGGEGRGGREGEAAAVASLTCLQLIFNQTFYCLNTNQDFKICVTAELRLYRKCKRKGSNKSGERRDKNKQ